MCEVLDAYEKRGRELGHTEGRNEGITLLIEALRELGHSTECIMGKVSEKFGLSESEARCYMK